MWIMNYIVSFVAIHWDYWLKMHFDYEAFSICQKENDFKNIYYLVIYMFEYFVYLLEWYNRMSDECSFSIRLIYKI